MTYDEMLAEIANAKPATADGVEALHGFKPHIAKSGLRNDPLPERLRAAPLTGAAVSALMKALAPVIAQHVAERIEAAVQPLQQQIADLQARPTPKWRGTFVEGAAYKPLEFAVDRGALWICKADTTARPGTSSDWQLCCKSGSHNGR